MKWLFDKMFAQQVFHNMFYSLLGVVQYTIWEGIILHCYATGRLPYLTNKEVVSMSNLWIGTLSSLFFFQVASDPWNFFFFVLSFFAVPLFRGVHFYFSHRLAQVCHQTELPVIATTDTLIQNLSTSMSTIWPPLGISITGIWFKTTRFIHIRALYKHIHAVHHRNTDIEPFAGLSMHPIEVGFRNKNILESKNCIVIFPLQHLYYFSCLVPSLLLLGSPFLLLWNGIHLLLSPGAPNVSKYCHQVLQILSSSLLDKKNSPKVPATVAGRMPCNQISIITCITGFTLFEIVLFLLVVFINSKF